MGTPYPLRPGEPDCRDFLRTGRCKYGESCKYNHPPNVESGGGVKPLNPSEPLYPIRPSEPPCQYFLKHGTCKFGQSCKFNHPSGTPVNLGEGGGNNLPAGLVFLTTNSAGATSITNADPHLMGAQTVQILPQRPTEPNCIYFLRNGRCKYGATCKFHHPLDAISRNQAQQQHFSNTNARGRDRSHSFGSSGEGRSQSQNVAYGQARLHPITERVRSHQPTHILLPDGQIALILDPQSLQNVSELNAQDRPKFYLSQANASIGTAQTMQSGDQNSVVISPMLTATSASSSHQTLESNMDLWGSHLSSQGQTSSGQLRNQAQTSGPNTISYLKTTTDSDNRSGSGGSLSAYGSVDSGQHGQGDYNPSQLYSQNQMPSMPQQKSWSLESNEHQPRRSPSTNEEYRARASSMGSTAEHSVSYYWPSAGSLSRQSNGGRSENADVGLPVYDQSGYKTGVATTSLAAAAAANQGVNHSNSFDRHSSMSPPASADHAYYSGPADQNLERHRRAEEASSDDDGLTMMTSALLTMMDRHSPSEEHTTGNQRNARQVPSASPHHGDQRTLVQSEKGYYHSEPNMQGQASPTRQVAPPPGMMSPSRSPAPRPNYQHHQDMGRSRTPVETNYVVGTYPQATSWSPSWGESEGSRY